MKILVTGATGFIGNYVVRGLLQRGIKVIASSADQGKAAKADWYQDVAYIPFDLGTFNDGANYYKYFDEPELMIHLAWEGLPDYKAAFHEEVNLPRHDLFLKNIIVHGLDDLTVTGTCLEYGLQEGCLREDMPVFPATAYGRAKNALRLRLEEFRQHHPFSLKWVRLFYMYGKGQNPRSLLSQLDRALANGENVFNMSGGEQVRDYLPVEKVADHIIAIACQKKTAGIINNCSGAPVTVKKFVEEYLKRINKNISLNLGYYPYPDYEPMRFWGDASKLKKILSNE
jgi:dTDP-6-deoxy-L-talose 4-dehydrogenase (NAD+)